jgi:hypothetical protein
MIRDFGLTTVEAPRILGSAKLPNPAAVTAFRKDLRVVMFNLVYGKPQYLTP